MMIAFKVLVICVLLAVTAAEPAPLAEYYTTYSDSILHVDNYINANRRQYSANIWSYDLQIQTFKDIYNDRLNTIETQKDLLINSLLKTDDRLYPLELLNDQSKMCVDKYKPLIPSVAAVKFNMNKCISTATNQVSTLVQYPTSTNTTLQNYYINTFDKTIQTCKRNNPSNATAYSICAENAVSAANLYTLTNQKTFATQLASAYSSANVNVKTAMDCSFAEQNKTISSMAQANSFIDKCRQGLDTCNIRGGYYCENVYNMPANEVDTSSRTMKNVFYGTNNSVQCVMVNVNY